MLRSIHVLSSHARSGFSLTQLRACLGSIAASDAALEQLISSRVRSRSSP